MCSSEISTSSFGIKIPRTLTPNAEVEVIKDAGLVDLPGHFNFRKTLLNDFLPKASHIILVLDSKDKERLPNAAEFLFDVLSDIDIVMEKIPILVVCNK